MPQPPQGTLECFSLISEVLVQYVQRSNGVIGQSSYREWAMELEQIIADTSRYPVLTLPEQISLQSLLQRWQGYADANRSISAFSS